MQQNQILPTYKAKKCQPTEAKPGSIEKVEVMRIRYESGQQIFHIDDATNNGETGAVVKDSRIRTAVAG